MSAFKQGSGGRNRRPGKNQFVTKSGKTIKVNRSLTERWVARKDAQERRRAERLAGLPKTRIKRFLYHFQPRRMANYWFSRDGGIMALKILGISFAAGFLILIGMFAYFRKDLPNITDVSGSNLGGSISYYDRTGQTLLWQDYDAVKRIPVKDENISNYIKQATVAVEDKDFYKHGGFDVRGIIRAGINDTFSHNSTQGGSTITQQLVKLTQNWTDNRTLTRKVKELILSVELEREYSKQQILAGYLNVAPYGNIEYGVEAAANDYFHKSAKDLTLDEAAFLAAIPKSPSIYSPYGPYFSKPDLLSRQHYILDLMVTQGMITRDQAEAAKKVDVVAKVQPQQQKYAGIKAPYFVLAAKSELENKFGAATVNRGGWKVVTTLDTHLQSLAEKAVSDDLPTIHRYGGDEAAFAAEDVKTGQMVALVGGTNFNDPDHGKINYAHDALIPPGSSFKPYDYASLIDTKNNVGAGSVLYDTQGPLPGYPCTKKGLPPPKGDGNCLEDYDFRYPGPMTLRYALGGSRNVPAVKANLIVGTDKVINIADAMMNNPSGYNCYSDEKLTQTTQCYGASAIGDGAFLHLDDHVNGLATLARMGTVIPRTYILKITDAGDKVIQQWKQPQGKQAVKADSAYIVNDMASDPNASYLPGRCTTYTCSQLSSGGYKFQRYNGWHFAVKTGTTNNAFDGLMASWSTQYAAVSWVGYHTRNKAMTGAMEYMTEPITRTWMQGAHDALNAKPTNWTQPSDIKTLPAFVVRSHVGIGSIEPSPSTDLFPSWYQSSNKNKGPSTIDIVSNKLATSCTPPLARKDVGNANSNSFSVDTFVGGSASSNTQATDDVHQCSDVKPGVTLNVAPAGNGSYQLSVNVTQGTHPISSDQFRGTINYIVGGKTIHSESIGGPGIGLAGFTYTPTFNGTQDLTAQVIDSVLYDATSDPKPVTGTGGTTNNSPLTLDTATVNGTKTNFSWSGGSGTVTVYRADTNASLCNSGPDSDCNYPVPLPGTLVYAQDTDNNKSNTVQVSP